MSIPNAPDDSKAHPHAEGAPRAGEHRVAAPTSETRSFSPVCLSCGFPRKGLGDAIVNCPECGARWVRVSDRHAWAAETRWGLGAVGVSLAAAVAIVAPRTSALAMLRSGELVSMICDWLLLLPATFFFLGLRAIDRASEGTPYARRAARLSLIVLVLLLAHASDAFASPLEGLSSWLGSIHPLSALHILQSVTMILLAVVLGAAMRAVGAVLGTIGHARLATLLTTVARPLVLMSIVFGSLSTLHEELSLINDRWPKGPFTWWTFSAALITSIGAWSAFTLTAMGLLLLGGASIAFRWIRFYERS